eukprot:COSAG01_NODE_7839_length_3032_cov_1.855779_1_plen_100_part_00
MISFKLIELEKLCDAYKKQQGQAWDKNNKNNFSLEWQFAAGRSVCFLTTQEGKNPTWCYKHNFIDGKGVYMTRAYGIFGARGGVVCPSLGRTQFIQLRC